MFIILLILPPFLYIILNTVPHIINFIYSRMQNKAVHDRITDKWILITGASDGIGKSLALEFAKLKYKLIILGRNESKLRIVEEQLLQHTPNVIIKVYDFNQTCDFSEFQNFDIAVLINNAGVSYNGPQHFINDNMEEIINVNILNTFKISKVVLGRMMDNKMGYILNIGSITGDFPMPMYSAYAASKSMLKAWSEALYYECKMYHINVECMDTGFVATKMSKIKKKSLFCPDSTEYAKSIVKHFGSGRLSFAYWPHLVVFVLISMMPKHVLGMLAFFYLDRKRRWIAKNKS